MRIGILVDTFPAASESFVIDQLIGLLDREQDVEVIARALAGSEMSSAEFIEYQLMARSRSWPSMPIARGERLVKAVKLLAARGARDPRMLRTLNVFRYGRRARSLELLYMSLAFLGRRPPDVLHCHFGPNGLLAVALRDALKLSSAVVTTFHGFDLTRFVRANGAEVYSDLFRSGDRFLVVSDYLRDRLVEMGCDPERIVLHRLGVDTDVFTPGEGRRNVPIRLLSAARLTEKKGLSDAIEAVRVLADRGVEVHYLVAGDGPLKADLETLIRRLDLSERVTLLGVKRRIEVRELLRTADIFVAPSLKAADGDEEGIPIGIMEAMATGLPIVSTKHSGIPELVEEGVSGSLVPERDPVALADSVVDLCDDEHLRVSMGRAGRKIIEDRYSMRRSNDELLEILGETHESMM